MRCPALVIGVLALCAGHASGQAATSTQPASQSAPFAADSEAKRWSFFASAYTYFLKESGDYVQPTFTADRGRLHLEARYNYEDLETGSAWVGVTFGGGEKLTWEVTPMVGGVFGNSTGVAPGYKGTLGWWKLGLYTEGEYLIDPGDRSANFFYSWSEFTLSPNDWFRVGVVEQRTHAYESAREVQWGLLAGFTHKKLDVVGYTFFNAVESRPVVVVAASVAW